MDLTTLLVQIVGGAVGGNVAGAAMKDKSLGTIGNSIAGALGGGIGGQLLSALGVAVATGGTDLSSLAGNAGTGGAGGAVLLIVIALAKKISEKVIIYNYFQGCKADISLVKAAGVCLLLDGMLNHQSC